MKVLFFLLCITVIFNQKGLADEEHSPSWTEEWANRWVDQLKYLRAGPSMRERISLKAGLSATSRIIRGAKSTEEHLNAPGFHTYLSFQFTEQWELALGGYVFFGKTSHLNFTIAGNQVRTNGAYRDTTFAPTIRFLTPLQYEQNWNWYVIGGPSWSQQTVKLEDFIDVAGNLRHQHKITLLANGGTLGFGLQEKVQKKRPDNITHPVYIEFLYSYMLVNRITLVDASNFSEVQTVNYEDSKRPASSSIYILNFGMAIF